MPTVLKKDGFDVMIYTNDHMPRHVHVFKGDEEIIINVDTLTVRASYMSGRNARKALELVEDNQAFLISEWDRIKPVP